MKKIGIDARLYSQTGVGTYLQNLLYYLEQADTNGEIFYIYLTKKDYDSVSFKKKNFIKREAGFAWHSFSEQIGFALMLYRDGLDLMHFTYFSYPVVYLKKFIATVHDATPLLFKTGKASTKNQFVYNLKHFFFKIVVSLQVKMAVKIITPADSVKKQLVEIYGAGISQKIQPIYEGVSYKVSRAKENASLGKKFKDFFIYVGNFYPHKNVEKLIDAFTGIAGKYRLVLIGPNDYFTERITRYINSSKAKNKITLLKSPPTADLVFFYKNAEAIIHPSKSEGFGLPLVEAAYFNSPMIASNIDVFKELWADQYLSFNPNDINDIFEKIKSFIDKKPGFDYKDRLKKYSFAKMTEETLKVYHKVTQNS